MELSPGCLYLTDRSVPFCPGSLVICCGEQAAAGCPGAQLLVPQPDLWMVFNRLQQLYAQLDRWDAQLQAILEENGTMQQLMDVGSSYIGNLLVVSSAGLETISSSQQGRQRRRSDEKWDRPLDTSDLFAMKEPMAIAREKTGIQWIRQPMWEYEFMYANLLEGRAKLGTLALLPVERPLEQRDACLLEQLLRYAQQMMGRLTRAGSEPLASLHRGLQMLLRGSMPPPEKLEYWQTATGFEPGDPYVCLVIGLPREVGAEYQGVLSRAILAQLPRAVLFAHENDLVLVIDRCQTPDLEGVYGWLEGQLQHLDLAAGVSDQFYDLTMLPGYYREAQAALQLGQGRLRWFDQYREAYLLDRCVGELSPELLYTPGFRRILAHDADSTVDYLESLQIWLEEAGNEARAAARLHICRNTFLYRKKQMIAMLGGEADTAEGRFCLMLCLRLQKLAEKGRHKAQNL